MMNKIKTTGADQYWYLREQSFCHIALLYHRFRHALYQID